MRSTQGLAFTFDLRGCSMGQKRFSGIALVAAILPLLVFVPLGATGQAVTHGHAAKMDPDHHFVRDLADHNEAMVLLAHSAMQMKHAHAGGTDAAGAMDVVEDARKRELVALLKTRFKDTREPVPPPALKQQVDDLMKLDGEENEKAVKRFSQAHHQTAIDMIDRAKLRRPEIRSLAKRIRAQYLKEMREAGLPAH